MDLVKKYFAALFLDKPHMHWLFFASALGLALISFFYFKRKDDSFSLKRFIGFCVPKSVYLHRSAKVDYFFVLVDPIISTLIFVPALAFSTHALAFQGAQTLLQNWWGDASSLISQNPDSLVNNPSLLLIFALGSILVFDFGFYLQHYLMHRISFLWEFHKVHHSAEVLTPLTFFRVHPVDWLSMSTVYGLLVGGFQGAYMHFTPTEASLTEIMGFNVVTFAFYFMGVHLRHSHIWISYGQVLSRIFISPAQHQIHHSVEPRHYDKNLGSMFALWDWLFGTLYVPRKKEDIQYGLAHGEHKEFSTLWSLYVLPFQKNARSSSMGKRLLTFLFIAVLFFFAVQRIVVTLT